MMDLRPHRGWLSLLVLALFLAFAGDPVLRLASTGVARDLSAIKAATARAGQNLRQLEEDAAAARKLGSQMDAARAEQFLAPVNRLKAAAMLEHQAAAARLLHFTYTLAPEERVTVADGGETQELALSVITLSAGAPQDTDAYAFLAQALRALPGRARIRQLSLTRIDGGNAPPSAINLRLEATLEWLSNGSLQTLAGGP